MSKATIVFEAPFWSRSGYGDHARDLLKSLIDINQYDIKIITTNWGDCPNDAYPEYDEYQLKDPKIRPNVYIKLGVPNEVQIKAPYSIVITAGIETTYAPAEWLDACNRMDLIIVPSQHSRNVLLNTVYDKMENGQKIGDLKCTTPIEVLFEGVDTDLFYKLDKQEGTEVEDILNEIPEDFCYLFAGHWIQGGFGHDRKDVGSVIKTFIETFKNTGKAKRPALILKTSGATFSIIQYEDIYKKIKEITDVYKGVEIPNIYVIEGGLSPTEMNCLYNHKKVKAMVSFTHGEGYGRPLAEFCITQKPVIASNWSGQVDFLTHSIKLPGTMKKVHPSAANNMILKDSSWFYVDYGYASKVMKDVFKNYKKYIPDARKQARLIREDFNLNEMTNKFKALLDSSLPKFAKKIKLNIPKLEKVNE